MWEQYETAARGLPKSLFDHLGAALGVPAITAHRALTTVRAGRPGSGPAQWTR